MECKVQKYPVVVFDKESESSNVDGTCTSCSRCGSKFVTWTNLALLFVLFLSNIFLHYKCMTISNELSELRTRGVPPHASHLTSSIKEPTSDVSHHNSARSVRQSSNRQGGRRRRRELSHLERKVDRNAGAIERILSRPAIHLRGSNSQSTDTNVQNTLFPQADRRNTFRWEHLDPNYPDPSFRYVNDMQDSTRILAVNITNPGMYLIYSQVTVNGRYTYYDPAYGLETVRKKPGQSPDILLQSFVTQDGRGNAYPNIATYPGTRYPVDFISHIGMFELECDDIVYVKIPNQSTQGHYLKVSGQTHFGLELIKPKYNYLDNLYGC